MKRFKLQSVCFIGRSQLGTQGMLPCDMTFVIAERGNHIAGERGES
jgi:hypothetical protein